jgi:hypothetical protein
MEEFYKMIDVVVAENKEFRQRHDYLGLIQNGQRLLNSLPKLIDYSTTQESEYRKFEAKELERLAEEKGRNGVAETNAKATDQYREWQRASQTIEMIYHLANMAKRLASDVDNNYKASMNK